MDKTADFGSIKAFRMDRLAEHTEQEAFGSSVTLAALDAFSTTPFGFASPQQMVLHVLAALLRQTHTGTRFTGEPQGHFSPTMLEFPFNHLQKSKHSHTYHLAVTPQNSLFPFQVEI